MSIVLLVIYVRLPGKLPTPKKFIYTNTLLPLKTSDTSTKLILTELQNNIFVSIFVEQLISPRIYGQNI